MRKRMITGNIFISGFTVLLLFTLILQCARDPMSSANQNKPADISPERIIHSYHKLYAEIESQDIYISPVISARFLMSFNMTIREVLQKFDVLQVDGTRKNQLKNISSDSLLLAYMLNTSLSEHLSSIFSNRVKKSRDAITHHFSVIETQLLADAKADRDQMVATRTISEGISDSVAYSMLPPEYIQFPDFATRDSLISSYDSISGHSDEKWVHSLLKYQSILPEMEIKSIQSEDLNKFIPLNESELYKEALEVYTLSKPLQSEYKWIAEFWSDDLPGVTYSPATRWISILNQVLEKDMKPFEEVHELYFLLSLVMHETAVTCWSLKYSSMQVRPSMYIQSEIDRVWKPFHDNPPFPAYPSGHSAFGAAAAFVLEHFFGKSYSFTDNSHKGNKAFLSDPRSYHSFKEMAAENAISRLYMGVHFRKDCEDGLLLGETIAKYVLENNIKATLTKEKTGQINLNQSYN